MCIEEELKQEIKGTNFWSKDKIQYFVYLGDSRT